VMAIPKFTTDYEQQRVPYRLLKQAVIDLEQPSLKTFSFGMSGDIQAAIAEGSTMVRVGTGIFGKRN